MKTHITLVLALLFSLAAAGKLHTQSVAFSYQGRLVTDGSTVNGRYDFRFTIHDSAEGDSPVSDPEMILAVGVTNGLFSALLNVPPGVFNGGPRWLAIAVRSTGSNTFTPLNPCQPITPAPYALTALNVPGLDGHSLRGASGGPTNAVFADSAGNVGIGTSTPITRLQVVSAANDQLPPRLESSSTDRFNAGWDFYHGTTGKGYVGVPDPNAPFAPDELLLFGGPGTRTTLWAGGVRCLTADTIGNVGIGTANAHGKLDVRGDVILGPNGEFDAVGSPERLCLIRGKVSSFGNILAGTGFQVAHETKERYTITFSTPFTSPPVVTCTADLSAGIKLLYMVGNVSARSADVFLWHSVTEEPRDANFHFIAIGPR